MCLSHVWVIWAPAACQGVHTWHLVQVYLVQWFPGRQELSVHQSCSRGAQGRCMQRGRKKEHAVPFDAFCCQNQGFTLEIRSNLSEGRNVVHGGAGAWWCPCMVVPGARWCRCMMVPIHDDARCTVVPMRGGAQCAVVPMQPGLGQVGRGHSRGYQPQKGPELSSASGGRPVWRAAPTPFRKRRFSGNWGHW